MKVIVHLVNINWFINIFIIKNHSYMMAHINYVISNNIEWGNVMMLEFLKLSIGFQNNIFPYILCHINSQRWVIWNSV